MKKLYILITLVLIGSCAKVSYKATSEKEHKSKEGYHSNEANRVIDHRVNNQGKIAKIHEKNRKIQSENLNLLNKPNEKTKVKKKRSGEFNFF